MEVLVPHKNVLLDLILRFNRYQVLSGINQLHLNLTLGLVEVLGVARVCLVVSHVFNLVTKALNLSVAVVQLVFQDP